LKHTRKDLLVITILFFKKAPIYGLFVNLVECYLQVAAAAVSAPSAGGASVTGHAPTVATINMAPTGTQATVVKTATLVDPAATKVPWVRGNFNLHVLKNSFWND
jgi:hypothetical protein